MDNMSGELLVRHHRHSLSRREAAQQPPQCRHRLNSLRRCRGEVEAARRAVDETSLGHNHPLPLESISETQSEQ